MLCQRLRSTVRSPVMNKWIRLFLCIPVWTIFAQDRYSVQGTVKDLYTGRPMVAVNVYIQELQKGVLTDSAGHYKISDVKKGYYTLIFTRIGYRKMSRKLQLFRDLDMSLKLEEQSIVFAAQEITPGITELSTDAGASSTVSSQEISSTPSVFGKDVYRALQVVPGIQNSEWSSKPHIKGGNPDETAVMIDNLEIKEPFHLEEIDGPYSVISSDLVKSMKVITGGFAPKYTDKMSGIIAINTVDNINDDSIKASIDFSGAAFSLHQRINDRTNVFFSGRRSYIFLLENASNTNFPSTVWDIWTKLDYKLDSKNRFSLNLIYMYDNIRYSVDSVFIRNEFFKSAKTNYYAWFNWYRYIDENRYFSTTIGVQDLNKRASFSFDGSYTSDNHDNRGTVLWTVKQDHFWRLFHDHSVEFGGELNGFASDYFYREYRLNPTETTPIAVSTDVIYINRNIEGFTIGSYVQDTYKYTDQINVMLGLRLTGQTYGDGPQVGPRSAISYTPQENLNFKFAYGWFYQPDNFQKMKAYDNQYKPEARAEKAIHYILSGTYLYNNTSISLDGFYKDYPHLNDDYNFDFGNRIEGVGIVDKNYNTQSGFATGLDMLLRQRYGRLNNNLLTLAYSLETSHLRNERNLETYRDLDRTHSVTINTIYNFPSDISLSGLYRIRSGDPYTPSRVQILGDGTVRGSKVFYITETKNSARLPVFQSLDVKIEKKWNLGQMYMTTYASVINTLDHKNIRQRAWKRNVYSSGYLAPFTREDQLYFPRFVSLGASIEFSIPKTK